MRSLLLLGICQACLLLAISQGLQAEEDEVDDSMPSAQADRPKKESVRQETLRSQHLAKQLQQTDKETETIWLGSGKEEFLGLYRPDSSGSPFANIIILHDNLQHPDWPGIIHQLRTELSLQGWNTLSIALPDYAPKNKAESAAVNNETSNSELDTDATEPPDMMPSAMPDSEATETPLKQSNLEYEPEHVPSIMSERVKQATEFLVEKSPAPIIVACHGLSATVIAKEAQSMLVQNIQGLIIIDPVESNTLQDVDVKLDALDLRVPVLDIAPGFNPRSAPQLRKKNATRLRHSGYRQRTIDGAKQNFSGAEMQLVKTVRGWGEFYFKK